MIKSRLFLFRMKLSIYLKKDNNPCPVKMLDCHSLYLIFFELVNVFKGISTLLGYFMPNQSFRNNFSGSIYHIAEEDKEVLRIFFFILWVDLLKEKVFHFFRSVLNLAFYLSEVMARKSNSLTLYLSLMTKRNSLSISFKWVEATARKSLCFALH